MSTSVIVISDDVRKSETISDYIAQSLESGGFKNVNCTYPRARPAATVGEVQPQPETLLQSIQTIYPDFLNETVNVRAIKVEGMDVNGYDEDDEEAAFQKDESAQRSKFGNQFHTTVSLFEDRPSKKSLAENRAKAATERRAEMHLIDAKKHLAAAEQEES